MTTQADQTSTVRARVLAILDAATRPLSGIEIARTAGLPYKPTIDALNMLLNYAKVRRLGRKHTARWTRADAQPSPACQHLDALFGSKP